MNTGPLRPSKELKDLINYVRAKYYLMGKKPPSITKITQVIAEMNTKDQVLQNVFIKFN